MYKDMYNIKLYDALSRLNGFEGGYTASCGTLWRTATQIYSTSIERFHDRYRCRVHEANLRHCVARAENECTSSQPSG